MFIYEIWLFDWYFPQLCKSDMSKYETLEVYKSSRKRESTVYYIHATIKLFFFSEMTLKI